MLGKRPRPMIGKLSELLVSGNKPGFLDATTTTTSPKTPLDLRSSSPRGLKRYDAAAAAGGVGLGIVAALEKSSSSNNDSCSSRRIAICSPKLNRSNPIVVNSISGRGRRHNNNNNNDQDFEMGISLENYTYVTSHGPGQSSSTKVYYDGGDHHHHHQRRSSTSNSNSNGHDRKLAVKETTFLRKAASRFVVDDDDNVPTYPTSDFLSCCHLCRKKLHGKDIYMYRGEKAFCSSECRSTQIMMDERKEQCRSEASRSAKVSSSPYNNPNNNTGQIFSTGILAI